jgi:hypothetical protein
MLIDEDFKNAIVNENYDTIRLQLCLFHRAFRTEFLDTTPDS